MKKRRVCYRLRDHFDLRSEHDKSLGIRLETKYSPELRFVS